MSVRFGPDAMLITPSGIGYDKLQPMDMVLLDLEGTLLEQDQYQPSSEWRMHADIYRNRLEAGAILHAHPVHCTALACLKLGIPSFHYMVAIAGGRDIRCSEYHVFGSQDLSDAMLEALKDRTACLLGNHGMICFASDPKQALDIAIEMEALAHQYIQAFHIIKAATAKNAKNALCHE